MKLIEDALIEYIDIGIDQSSKLIRWKSDSSNVHRLDIMAARSSAHQGFYKRIEKSNLRTIFTKKRDFTFIICTKENVQYQLMEAVLDEIIVQFFNIYGEQVSSNFISGGMETMFEGFENQIPHIIEEVQKNKVKWVRSHCKLCHSNHKVYVKRSLVENADNYPVSLVYFHLGHGILLHIDANFQVRGTEIVNISG